jgi:glycosyltransferase involved in cell wall biosynthesis
VTVNSSVTENAVRELAPGIGILQRIPMGVSVRAPTAEQESLSAEVRRRYRRGGGPLVLFVGRLVQEKGVADLLHALALLRHDLPDSVALVVGEGQDRADFARLAGTLELRDRAVFIGWITPAEIPAYMNAADVFVGPSRRAADGWVEAQGLTFLEAMAARTPVVATRLGGVVDSVIDDQTGLLVDERSPDQIARAIRRCVGEPALGSRLTAAAYQQVTQRYSREASASRFSALFERLSKTPGGLVNP